MVADSRAVMAAAGSLVGAAWALIAPVDCAGCSAPDVALCRACAAELRPRLRLAVLDAAVPDAAVPDAAAAPGVGPGSAASAAAAVPLVAPLPYEGVARRVVLALKECDRTELARVLRPAVLAAVEGAYVRAGPGSTPLLVPVPGGSSGAARRGYHPAELLARRAGLRVTRALRPAHGRARAQKRLTLAQRHEVDAARWRVSPRVLGARVVLLDDVVTSGSTLRAAARALRAAGAEVVACAAVAATPRRVGESSILWRFSDDPLGRIDDKHVRGGLT
ncbi:MAG: ComF family protein [Actinobacteria bacterium]|nr:ComF family protein [Actinomycetota bacterium]MBU1609402.1 ComF family protein [Actinomycetota bacterium]MBU2315035.1 ComF family protein [Actinomycetota bacterium]